MIIMMIIMNEATSYVHRAAQQILIGWTQDEAS